MDLQRYTNSYGLQCLCHFLHVDNLKFELFVFASYTNYVCFQRRRNGNSLSTLEAAGHNQSSSKSTVSKISWSWLAIE